MRVREYISFENEKGKALMFPGGDGEIRITALSGFDNPERSYSRVKFAGKSGQKTTGVVENARTMVINGDVRGTRADLERLLKIFAQPGKLTIDYTDKKREITCSSAELSLESRHGGYTAFVLTLIGDGVYFTDTVPTERAVFKRQDLLEGDIVFPCVFTQKTTSAALVNYGEVNVEPVINIFNLSKVGESTEGTIEIKNLTTGQKIRLNTSMLENEKITVDIAERKVTSSERGSLLTKISDDTFLNRFQLAPGENIITASHENEGEEITVSVSYCSCYREGIF